MKCAQDARKLVIRMNLARRVLNVLIVENVMLHIIKNAVFIKRSVTFNQSGCPEIFPFLKLDKFIKRLMDRGLLLLLYALFNHPRLLIQVARVQKAQFSYRLDGLVP